MKQRIFELYIAHKGMAGSPMITVDLDEEPESHGTSKNTVARLMREMKIKCKTVKKFVATTEIKAFNKAVMRCRPDKDLMVHSDRGVQYASKEFKKCLKFHGIIQRMSRKGDCWKTPAHC